MALTRRAFALSLAAAALPAASLRAHHGYMRWDEDNPVTLEGWISSEMDGFPHYEFEMRVDGVDWEVDVGDQFQLEKAGLSRTGDEFTLRREVRVTGVRPIDREIHRILPSRITLDGDEVYDISVREGVGG